MNKEKNMYVIVFGEYHTRTLRTQYQKQYQKCKQKSNNNQVSIGTYIKQLVSTQPYFFDILAISSSSVETTHLLIIFLSVKLD